MSKNQSNPSNEYDQIRSERNFCQEAADFVHLIRYLRNKINQRTVNSRAHTRNLCIYTSLELL